MTFIQSLPMPVFLVMFAIFAAMTGICVYAAFRSRKLAALISATPTSNVNFATDGYVEFEGVAQPIKGKTLTAPLSGAACLWYHARLDEWKKGHKDYSWHVVQDTISSAPFLLQDNSGPCVVIPYGAEVTYTDHSVWFGPGPVPDDRNPPRVAFGTSAVSSAIVYGMPDKKYRYTEERIYAGDPLYALGRFATLRDDIDPADDDDEAAAGTEEADVNGKEPEDPRAAAVAAVGAWDDDAQFDALIQEAWTITHRHLSHAADRPYLLSTTPQAKLLEVHGKGWKASLFVAIVPAAIALALVWFRFFARE